MNNVKSYSELIEFDTFKDRYNYLKLSGVVGEETFGWDRYLNQILYHTREWKRVRDFVITRDRGCDLAVEGMEIPGKIIIHHMNPITPNLIKLRDPIIFEPEFLITVSIDTHNGIHFGTEFQPIETFVERKEGDTCLWKKVF